MRVEDNIVGASFTIIRAFCIDLQLVASSCEDQSALITDVLLFQEGSNTIYLPQCVAGFYLVFGEPLFPLHLNFEILVVEVVEFEYCARMRRNVELLRYTQG